MKSNQELSVDIHANLCVSDETACRCLRIIEFYLSDNRNKRIVAEQDKDGATRLRIEEIWK